MYTTPIYTPKQSSDTVYAVLLTFFNLFQDTTNLKGNYLAAKAVYESGDDHNDALLILESGVSLVEKAMHNLEKGRPMTGKFGAVSAMGLDGDSPVENTRRVSKIE